MNRSAIHKSLHMLHLLALGILGFAVQQQIQENKAEDHLAETTAVSFAMMEKVLNQQTSRTIGDIYHYWQAYITDWNTRKWNMTQSVDSACFEAKKALDSLVRTNKIDSRVSVDLYHYLATIFGKDSVYLASICPELASIIPIPELQNIRNAQQQSISRIHGLGIEKVGFSTQLWLSHSWRDIEIIFSDYECSWVPEVFCPAAGDTLSAEVFLSPFRLLEDRRSTIYLNGRKLPCRYGPYRFTTRFDTPGRHALHVRAEVPMADSLRVFEKTCFINVR